VIGCRAPHKQRYSYIFHTRWSYMDDEKIIKEDFKEDNSKIISIKPIPVYVEHYYLVTVKDNNGKFEVEV
jgi:hypothetical protein